MERAPALQFWDEDAGWLTWPVPTTRDVMDEANYVMEVVGHRCRLVHPDGTIWAGDGFRVIAALAAN